MSLAWAAIIYFMACELDPRVDLTFVRLQKNFVTYKDIHILLFSSNTKSAWWRPSDRCF